MRTKGLYRGSSLNEGLLFGTAPRTGQGGASRGGRGEGLAGGAGQNDWNEGKGQVKEVPARAGRQLLLLGEARVPQKVCFRIREANKSKECRSSQDPQNSFF